MSALSLKLVRSTFALFIALLLVPNIVSAHELKPVSYETPTGDAFRLKVGNRVEAVNLAELEGLGMFETTTPTPWEKGELTVQGPLFKDVIVYLGLSSVESVSIVAQDGYVVVIPRSDWENGPLLLATRKDGKLLSRREQGPTRLIYPLISHPEYAAPIFDARWIWLIESIETSEDIGN